MYQIINYDRMNRKIHLWDDIGGYSTFKYKRYAYKKSASGEFTTLFGDRCTRVFDWKESEVDAGKIFESDVPVETRTLIDLYPDSDEISTGHRRLIYDIEVEKGERGYAQTDDPFNRINSIAIWDGVTDDYHVLILDEANRITYEPKEKEFLHVFTDEESLLNKFIDIFCEIRPTIISGWNNDYFDTPYLYNRCCKILGKPRANLLSPIGILTETRPNEYGRTGWNIFGVNSFDYYRLYKKFTFAEKPSYKLESIAQEELGEGKVDYDGDLQDLYNVDIDKFIEYNIQDVALVKKLDEKLDFIEIAQGICHKGRIPYDNLYFSSTYLDGAALVYLRKLGIVAPNKPIKMESEVNRVHHKDEKVIEMAFDIPKKIPKAGQLKIKKSKSSSFKVKYSSWDENVFNLIDPLPEMVDIEYEVVLDFPGAYVMDPITGRHVWVFDLDLKQLYPSEIMTQNISPETKRGKILNWDVNGYINRYEKEYILERPGKETEYYTRDEIQAFLNETKYIIGASGVLYESKETKKGFLPAILEKWAVERDEYKGLRKKFENDDEKYNYFDKKQYIQKVLLNSFYGVLGLPSFRFYDIDNAESITLGGQKLIKFTIDACNKYYTDMLGVDKDYVIYCDTDSIFVSSVPIIEHRHPGADLDDESFMTEKTLLIAEEVQTQINELYTVFAKRIHNTNTHVFSIKQEFIARSAFWVAKKRYAQRLINKEGKSIDKLDVKGLDVIKSNFPKDFREFMTTILNDILDGKEKPSLVDSVLSYKASIKDKTIVDIMFPTSIKEYEKYIEDWDENVELFGGRIKGTTAAAKATLNYNELISEFDLKSYDIIHEGDKIIWTYLKKNPYRIEQLALTGHNDPQEIYNYVKEYIDYKRIFEAALYKKLQAFFTAMNWGMVPERNVENEFFQFTGG